MVEKLLNRIDCEENAAKVRSPVLIRADYECCLFCALVGFYIYIYKRLVAASLEILANTSHRQPQDELSW